MAKKIAPEVNGEQKTQTKYDRKMEARRKKEVQDKKDEKVFKITSSLIGIALVLAIVIGIAYTVISKQTALSGTYIEIGEEEVSKLEFDYYYNTVVNNYLTMYSSLIPYMGLNANEDFADQAYSDTMSWKDLFEQMAVEQMSQTFALVADANASGFTYDVEADYNTRLTAMEETATAGGKTIAEHYKTSYGEYATVSNIESFIKEGILASAYYQELLDTNAPSEEEVAAYYEEHVKDYDKVDYRSFAFSADVAEDASEEDITKAMEDVKAKAEEFMSAREGGADFEELSVQNASEEEKATYEDTETEASFKEGSYRASAPGAISDWLYEDGRSEGEIAVLADEINHQYYVVEFVKRYYDETDNEKISNLLASERVTEYVSTLMESFQVTDSSNHLKYLTVETEVTEAETTEAETTDETETAVETEE